ncbi:MAG: hypothetical protein ACPGO5_00615 [Patescibacteria group bacterium]
MNYGAVVYRYLQVWGIVHLVGAFMAFVWMIDHSEVFYAGSWFTSFGYIWLVVCMVLIALFCSRIFYKRPFWPMVFQILFLIFVIVCANSTNEVFKNFYLLLCFSAGLCTSVMAVNRWREITSTKMKGWNS